MKLFIYKLLFKYFNNTHYIKLVLSKIKNEYDFLNNLSVLYSCKNYNKIDFSKINEKTMLCIVSLIFIPYDNNNNIKNELLIEKEIKNHPFLDSIFTRAYLLTTNELFRYKVMQILSYLTLSNRSIQQELKKTLLSL